MKTIAFFNSKGGVGKTSLVYHLAWMFSELGYRVVAADLDPQANLSGMFVDGERLEELWRGENGRTIYRDIKPLFTDSGDISAAPCLEKAGERIGLLVGDLGLSWKEDQLSEAWSRCLGGHREAYRMTTVFSRLIGRSAKSFHADVSLIDTGPNLGALNRAALIASDHVVVPLAPDLFSIQGLCHAGPVLDMWREEWSNRKDAAPKHLNFDLPEGKMEPLGYIVMRRAIRLDRPVKAYRRWMERIPSIYRESFAMDDVSNEEACLAHVKNYRSLMSMAQEAGKPMFMLRPADGAMGAHQSAMSDCYKEFRKLARRILAVCDIQRSDPA